MDMNSITSLTRMDQLEYVYVFRGRERRGRTIRNKTKFHEQKHVSTSSVPWRLRPVILKELLGHVPYFAMYNEHHVFGPDFQVNNVL